MAFNADDIWEFPAAAVVAAKAAVQIGPLHAAPADAIPGAILQAAVLQHEAKQVEIRRKLISKLRSWRPNVRKHRERLKARELGQGRLRRRRLRAEREHQDGSRCQ
jgi:hypothetical protein